jgi:cyclopropane fatty-acyl-phospholipid synthase-like methyltransferase
MQNFWDSRYALEGYVYGIHPNSFLKESLIRIEPGAILFPAEGEGRNAVFAAKLSFSVTAFDSSTEGMKKAIQLALENKVEIDYRIESYEFINLPENKFDVMALIFAHMAPDSRRQYHRKLLTYLKPGGLLILQGFSKEQINYNSGGPRDINMLFSEEELKSDFSETKTLNITSELTLLSEGDFHKGKAAVINVLGYK